MKRDLSGWGVTIVGLTLAGVGLYAMWSGWDMILLERGWSLFIAGSVALSGGVVTMALGRVIAHLARLGSGVAAAPTAPAAVENPAPASPAPEQAQAPSKPEAPPEWAESAAASDHADDRPDFASILGGSPQPVEEPTEVDRYTAGDATYVMMSDGSVEVRGASGSQRYPSLAALRAEAESRQR